MGYYARVKVWDKYGMPSEWSNPPNTSNNTFTTPIHAYPQVGFTPPSNPPVGQTVQFTDTTIFSPSSAGKRWMWWFCATAEECQNPTATQQNPTNRFYDQKTYGLPYIALVVQDNATGYTGWPPDGNGCVIRKPLGVGVRLRQPIWREIAPRP